MPPDDLKKVFVIGVGVGVFSQLIAGNLIPSPSAVFRVEMFFGFVALAPFALFVAHLLGKRVPVIYQFAKFAAVGSLNAAIDFGLLNLMIFSTGIASGAWYSVFKGASFLCATTNSFFWNKHWTFEARQTAKKKEAALFYAWAAGGWVLNVSVASVVVNGIGIPAGISASVWANVGALVGVGASFLWNFLGYKFVVFKKKGS